MASGEDAAGNVTPRSVDPLTRGYGTVSPNTLEGGVVVASPFHSQKVQDEVQLRNLRPASLDSDAKALGHVGEEESARLEREYLQQLSPESASPPQAARQRHGGGYQAGGEISGSSPLPGAGAPRALKPLESVETTLALVDAGTVAATPSDALALVGQADLLASGLVDQGPRPQPEDQRELVPAASDSLQGLLIKMMER